ncbi:acetate kinase [Celerinatantimonas yamalensis]|uniref:Acetate kinase n=1 Tax=Celerinatantimonas yamalensis TaxID=559956 RepID=A0ABW9G755_9GAMM
MSDKLVLVLNCGSSSLKFAILNPESGDEKITGLAECLTLDDARIKWKANGEKAESPLSAKATHQEAIDFIVTNILAQNPELNEHIIAVGHRIVSGGEKFTASVVVDDDVIKGLEECSDFAPLHNPPALVGIRAAMQSFPNLKHVTVFDTAFHQTMPRKAYLYGLPYKLYRDHGIRRYGAHGTSHRYVADEAAKMLGKDLSECNLITAHLGNGASISAIKDGQCVDTSMGLTPLEGVVMGTRSGDIDPAIIFHLVNRLGYSLDEVDHMLTKESGLLGLTEASSDCRWVEEHASAGDDAALRAKEVFCYRIAKYIASYAASLAGRLDAIVFTGGIGENAAPVRTRIVSHLGLLGVIVDEQANLDARFGASGTISTADSRPMFVIPTNEELVIARDATALVETAN